MTSVPYPTFQTRTEHAAMAAVGRCRVHALGDEYSAILGKCMQQHQASEMDNKEESKKMQKMYMKQSVALAYKYLTETLKLDVSVVDVEVVLDNHTHVRDTGGNLASCFLDAGCAKIVLHDKDTLTSAMEAARIPRERLAVHISDHATTISSVSDRIQSLQNDCDSISIYTDKVDELSDLLALGKQFPNVGVVVQTTPDVLTADLARTLLPQTASDSTQTTISLVDPTPQQLGTCYAACLKTDRTDGLFTTVVCTRSGQALGLVYSSMESIVAALECGRGVYYSRSRQGLWRKGDTSGHYQTLHRIDVDCDGDALRFTVTQRGDDVAAFCHLNTLTCWGPPRGISHLEETLQERLKSAPEGSYTKRLFEDTALLQEKLVEEAQELSEAESPQHVAEELADVLYFAMVRAAKAGVKMDDAVAELDRRARKVTRRKGDSKSFRIEAGKAILEKAKTNK